MTEIKKPLGLAQTSQTQATEGVSSDAATVSNNPGLTSTRDLFEASKPAASLSQAMSVQQKAVSPQEEKTIRSFYEETWNKGDTGGFEKHPKIAQQCAQTWSMVNSVFSQVQISVESLQKHGKEVWVNWTAEGTRKAATEQSPTEAKRESVNGLTRMKLEGDQIVWAKAQWNESSLDPRSRTKLFP